MGFLQSAINQVGRDMGRVVSNTVFKDRHAIPIRRAASRKNSLANRKPTQPKAHPIDEVKEEFEKSISFKTGYRPTTLISKLGGAFVVIKNESKAFVEDGYLDVEESQQLFSMMKQFADKLSDVEDVVSFTEDEDSQVYRQLEKIHESTKRIFVEVLEVSVDACKVRAQEHEQAAKAFRPIEFWRYVGLHLIWMPNYAKGGEKKETRAVIANILDVVTLTFPITRSILLLLALVTYNSENKEQKATAKAHRDIAHYERQRAKAYQEYIDVNSQK